jgi:hypothetical protein
MLNKVYDARNILVENAKAREKQKDSVCSSRAGGNSSLN